MSLHDKARHTGEEVTGSAKGAVDEVVDDLTDDKTRRKAGKRE